MKICTKCKIEKELIEFPNRNTSKDGKSSECKKCESKRKKIYRELNKNKIKEAQKEYYMKNSKLLKNNSRKYREENKAKCKKVRSKYYCENKEVIKDKVAIYATKNKEKIRTYKKEYYLLNQEKFSNGNSYRYNTNKSERLEYQKKYRQTEKGRAVAINSYHKRKSMLKDGDVNSEQILELRKSKHCYWCETSLENKIVHIDHYEPLSKGGLHTISNLVASCAECNMKKHTKDPAKFALEVGKLF